MIRIIKVRIPTFGLFRKGQFIKGCLFVNLFLFPLGILWGCSLNRPGHTPELSIINDEQQGMFREGVQAFERTEYDSAIKIFERVISGYPGSSWLPDAQWMLSRSYEGKGLWKKALSQYESFLSNYPTSPNSVEARIRIELINDIIQQDRKEKSSPTLVGIEVATIEIDPGGISLYKSNGLNSMVIDCSDPNEMPSRDDVGRIQKRGIYIFCLLRLNLSRIWDPEIETNLRQRFIELAIIGVDGVLFEDYRSSGGSKVNPFALDQFQRELNIKIESEETLKDPRLFWQWVGWQAQEIPRRLTKIVMPIIHNKRTPFYWGMIFPQKSITAPHEMLAERGLDLLQVIEAGGDYIGISLDSTYSGLALMEKARSLIRPPVKILWIIRSSGEIFDRELKRKSGEGYLFLIESPSEAGPLTKR